MSVTKLTISNLCKNCNYKAKRRVFATLNPCLIFPDRSCPTGPVAGVLCKKFSVRTIFMTGGCLIFIGYSSCLQISNMLWMYGTYSLLVGRQLFARDVCSFISTQLQKFRRQYAQEHWNLCHICCRCWIRIYLWTCYDSLGALLPKWAEGVGLRHCNIWNGIRSVSHSVCVHRIAATLYAKGHNGVVSFCPCFCSLFFCYLPCFISFWLHSIFNFSAVIWWNIVQRRCSWNSLCGTEVCQEKQESITREKQRNDVSTACQRTMERRLTISAPTKFVQQKVVPHKFCRVLWLQDCPSVNHVRNSVFVIYNPLHILWRIGAAKWLDRSGSCSFNFNQWIIFSNWKPDQWTYLWFKICQNQEDNVLFHNQCVVFHDNFVNAILEAFLPSLRTIYLVGTSLWFPEHHW